MNMTGAGANFSLPSTTITGRDVTINNLQHIGDRQSAQFLLLMTASFNLQFHTGLKRTIEDCTALGALHNSAGRYGSPRCYPETRTAALENIVQWGEDQA